MKYYIYVSDTKVDMLFAQIPRGIRDKLAAELKFDFQLLSATFTEKQSEETRYSKLKLVDNYMEKNLEIGTLENPQAYFRAVLPMKWGPVSMKDFGIVYFAGYRRNTFLGLGGSLEHVIGNKGESKINFRLPSLTSTLPYILSVLASALQLPEPFDEQDRDDSDELRESIVRANIYWAVFRTKGPVQRVEFLAKTLFMSQSADGKRFVLGTPIYVALAE